MAGEGAIGWRSRRLDADRIFPPPMTDSLARLSTALADRYRIERELGQGGMATVYLADDLKQAPMLRPLRHEPRCQAMRERMGLPENLRR